MMDDKGLAAYLDRIGVSRPSQLDQAALRELHRAHLLAVPFENLSIHLSEKISLREDDLIEKIVTRRRGGFCYELNGAFSQLLRALDADVTLASARVWGSNGFGPPFDHLVLIVGPPDGSGPWLADVGFGDHSVYPLLLDAREEQRDPGGQFRVADAADGDLVVSRNGQPQYRLERRARSLSDFVPTCWWQQTSPESHFTQSTICSRLTATGRVSLSGHTLIHTDAGIRAERELPSGEAVLAAYQEHFGISLERVPA